MVIPCRAAVRPRVFSPFTGETLLLEDAIPLLLETRCPGVIWLVGAGGSGKSVALQHLAATLPERIPGQVVVDAKASLQRGDVLLLDDAVPDRDHAAGVVVATAGENCPITSGPHDTVLSLAGWGRDECIEYLLAAHPSQSRSVGARITSHHFGDLYDGRPELWRLILDLMANDETIGTARAAVIRLIDQYLPVLSELALVRSWCLAMLQRQDEVAAGFRERFEKSDRFDRLEPLLRHTLVFVCLAAGGLVDEIHRKPDFWEYRRSIPEAVIIEVATLIRNDSIAQANLKGQLRRPMKGLHAAAASLLHAANVGWQPQKSRLEVRAQKTEISPCLARAVLRNASWKEQDLSGIDFSEADLNAACLQSVNIANANFSKSRLIGCRFKHVDGGSARFTGADLSSAQFEVVEFNDTNWQDARLYGAWFRHTQFRRAKFQRTLFEGAEFLECNFEGARLRNRPLRLARFEACRFAQADLRLCDLRGAEIRNASFCNANLGGAILDGTRLPGADLSGSCLLGACLPEIDWPGVNLRNADLRGATFHLGTTRSGLVDSPIASLGTRTGFYTDDYCEQDFKSPEEIRKANLRGADLRGANIEGVDFYLVDLRDAWFDPDQEAQFRATGALLSSGGDDERDRSCE